MSEIKVNSIVDASGGSTVQVNGYTPTVSNMAGRNRIINGDMRIDQRNAGAAVTPSTNSYTLDRWAVTMGAASKYSLQQVTDAPAGFYSSIKMTTTSAYATVTYFDLYQRIEGNNWNDMAWGTADAHSATVSFWVKSSVTGSYTGFIRSNDQALDVPFSYTISSANTWEYKTCTVAGATTGNWGGTNGIGAGLFFDFPNIIPTLNATWQITGVQLEAGSVATPFEHRQYGQELALCQRYFISTRESSENGMFVATGQAVNTSRIVFSGVQFPVVMRAAPTTTVYSASADTSGRVVAYNATSTAIGSGFTVSGSKAQGLYSRVDGSASLTSGTWYSFSYEASAEL